MSFQLCPLPTEMAPIPVTACDVDFGQINRAIVVRKTSAPVFTVTSGVPVVTSTTVTALLAATGNAKGILLPKFSAMELPETEPAIEGENDNSTVMGAGEIVGGNVVRIKPMFTSISSATAQALFKLNGENLQIIFFNQFNQAILKPTGYGFDIFNPTITDVTSAGLNKKNKSPWGFTMPYGWSLIDGFIIVDLNFNALNLVQ